MTPTLVLSAIALAAAQQAETPPAMASVDAVAIQQSGLPSDLFSGKRSRDVLAVQVLLDRAGHSPGVIDGMMGGNSRRAIAAFRKANGMGGGSGIDKALLDRLAGSGTAPLFTNYTISEKDVAGPFRSIPDTMTEKAKLESLAYESPAEALAEKFHMSKSFLQALNPGADFGKAGTVLTVVSTGSSGIDGKVARIDVDKQGNELRAYDKDGKLLATYPTTVGSSFNPSPDMTVEVLAIAPDPKYYFDPEGRDWGPDEKVTIAAGPNNPVGAVWIDLSKEGYGIHGTPDPALIGKTSSHGCVRLTNWDAKELAGSVDKGTKVRFI